jgi:hypothetical protein
VDHKTNRSRPDWRTPAGLILVALGAPLAAAAPAAAQDGQGPQGPPPGKGNAQDAVALGNGNA